mgnify:CR=1 FL=1
MGGMDFDWLLALEANELYRAQKGMDLIEGLSAVPKDDRNKRERVLGLEAGSTPAVNRGQAFRLLAQIERAKSTWYPFESAYRARSSQPRAICSP